MAELSEARCFNHARREAVARCPECGHTFCRECITEHERRVICAACLERVTGAPTQRRRTRRLLKTAGALAGFLTVWFLFYLLGQFLLTLPSAFHEGTFWEDVWSAGL